MRKVPENEYDVPAGERIDIALTNALQLVRTRKKPMYVNFNDTRIDIGSEDTLEELVQYYNDQRNIPASQQAPRTPNHLGMFDPFNL